MAREAILRDNKILVSQRFTCATGTAIPKGTLLKLGSDPYTAAAAAGSGDIFIGVAHADVNNSTDTAFNTETSVTADRGAIYEMVCSGSITLGNYVKTAAGGNYVMAANSNDVMSAARIIVGVALETGTAGETINVWVLP